MRLLLVGFLAAMFALPTVSRAEMPSEDIVYLHTMIATGEAGNMCRAIKGMANQMRWQDARGIKDDRKRHGEWCDNMFKTPDSVNKIRGISTDGRGLDITIDGRTWVNSILALRPQGRILMCELFWYWGLDVGMNIAATLERGPSCDNYDPQAILKLLAQ